MTPDEKIDRMLAYHVEDEKRIKQLETALRNLIREAQNVADDHHKPRYTRLDEALSSARSALDGGVDAKG